MSIAGGLEKAIERLDKVHGEALQIFSRNQRQWQSKALTETEAEAFRSARRHRHPLLPIAIHNSYLVNLAAGDPLIRSKSLANMVEELHRAEILGIEFVVMHPGSHGGAGIETGLRRVAQGLDKAFRQAGFPSRPTVLLETTAGQGTSLGSRFEELARIIDLSECGKRLGVCLDTCHIFAAGYDFRTEEQYERTMLEFARHIGFERLHFVHLNDAKYSLASRKDRHEHIGEGQIGLQGFRLLLNDRRCKDLPMVLETPKEKDLQEDIRNLAVLRGLMSPQA